MRQVILISLLAACGGPTPPPPSSPTPARVSTSAPAPPDAPVPTPPAPEPPSARLRISEPALYRVTPANQLERVAEHAVLRSRDRIRIEFVADREANVYVLQRHENGAIDVIAPSPEEGLLRVAPNVTTTIPDPRAGYEIELDDVTGADTLYVVVSVKPLDITFEADPLPKQTVKPKPRVLVAKPAKAAVGGPPPLVGRSNGWQAKGVRRTPKQTDRWKLEVEAPDTDDVIVRALHFRHE